MDFKTIANHQTHAADMAAGDARPHFKNWNLKPGLTLVELLAGFGLAGFVSVLVAALYFTHFRLFEKQNAAIDVSSQNKIAVDEITNQIRQSQAVADTCSGCDGDTTSATTLVLQTWPLDANDEPFEPLTNNYDFFVYKRDTTDNTRLMRKIITDPTSSRETTTKIIATEISDLTFAFDNATPILATDVTVTITTSVTSGGKTQTITQSSDAVIRNK